MSVTIKAHFDGKVIVPDTKLDLPPDQPLEVEVRFLSPAKASTDSSKLSKSKKLDITLLPFFGMWADREDMADGTTWVRKERERWSNRLSGTD